MRQRPLNLVALLCLLLLAGGAAAGQTRPAHHSPLDQLMDSLFRVRSFKEAAISPDGRWLAWVEALQEKHNNPSNNSAIYVADLKKPSANPRQITAGDGTTAHAEHD